MKGCWCRYHKIFILLFLILSPTAMACDPFGNITGANGQIILGSPGCADAPGNTQATIFPGASVINLTGDALIALILAGHNPWNISNYGFVQGSGQGMNLMDGGDTILNVGIIMAGGNGIAAPGGPGFAPITLENHGIIDAGLSGVLLLGGANVTNSGFIMGNFTGLSISDNGAPVSGLTSMVNNSGVIMGGSSGIDLGLGGTVINSGTVDGFIAIALKNFASSVTNSGVVGSSTASTAIGLGAGGTVVNLGLLQAQSRGISVDGGPGMVTNSGTIQAFNGRAIDFGVTSSGGGVTNSGTILSSGLGTRAIIFEGGPGVVINNSSGVIGGGLIAAIEMQLGNSIVHNFGSILNNVIFTGSNNFFLMDAGSMTGQLRMGTGGNETAVFRNVTETETIGLTLINGGGGGHDLLIFDHSTPYHADAGQIINWETINLINNSRLNLAGNLVLGGISADPTATLNINSSILNAGSTMNAIIMANTARPVLVNNNGAIDIADLSINNSLTIRGHYVGMNGSLFLNVVLGSDGSPANKLVIDGQNGGGSAIGNTFITINNLGGVGAMTLGNGILVVEAINSATTTPTAFALAAPVRAGAFDYRLFRGGIDPSDPLFSEDWFLRSTFIPTPTPNSNPFSIPSFIVGPELSTYGAILPLAIDMGRVMVGTLQERIGDLMDTCAYHFNCDCTKRPRQNGWARVFVEPYREHYASLVNPSTDGAISGFQVGINCYQHKSQSGSLDFAGIYMGYSRTNPDVDGLITNPEGNDFIETHTGLIKFGATSGSLYWTHFWSNGSYMDLVAQGTHYDGRTDSLRISLPARGNGILESAEFGYPVQFARRWTLQPEFQIMHQYVKLQDTHDAFSEVDFNASQTCIARLGAKVKHATCVNDKLITPYLRANVWSMLSGDKTEIVYAHVDTIETRSRTIWGQLGAGVTIDMSQHWALYAYVDDLFSFNNDHRSRNGLNSGCGVRVYM